MVATTDIGKKFFKPRQYGKFEELKKIPCVWHPASTHTIGECNYFMKRYTRLEENEKKEDE